MKKISVLTILVFQYLLNFSGSMMNYDKKFDGYKAMFTYRLWELYPEWATSVGFHKYDSLLNVPNDEFRKKEITFIDENLKKVKSLKLDSLNDDSKIDYYILLNFLENRKWEINTLKNYEWNPALYNVGEAFSYLISENYAPLQTRLSKFYLRLKNVKEYYDAAMANIKNPTNEHLKLAIDQNEGSLAIFEKDFLDSMKNIKLNTTEKAAYIERNKEAITAIKKYIEFLKNYKNTTPRNFRIGKELYDDKFKFEIQSQYTSNDILLAAEKRKNELQDNMYEISGKLWKKYFPKSEIPNDKLSAIRKMIDTISTDHVKPSEFKSTIEKQLPELTKFVKEKNLLFMDPTKPLAVRNEPGYMAGVAGASMSSPGPYEKNGKAYYNVGTLDGWSAEKAESYLREYNNYTLKILNIHEAIPGHYVQLMYSNNSPSRVKSIFGNNAMIEGWAVYSELLMLENGYNRSSEMWLMYYKWNLRSVCNTILDISVHTKNMSKEDAMDLLIKQAFQQKTEAEGKWNRVTLTNVQLTSYFTGFYEILKLRDDYKIKMGAKYSLKKFNEKFLSYGSAPVKYIREMMLKK